MAVVVVPAAADRDELGGRPNTSRLVGSARELVRFPRVAEALSVLDGAAREVRCPPALPEGLSVAALEDVSVLSSKLVVAAEAWREVEWEGEAVAGGVLFVMVAIISFWYLNFLGAVSDVYVCQKCSDVAYRCI